MPARAPAAQDRGPAAPVRVGGLDVEGDAARAGLGVAGRPAVRVLDHQVAVERQRAGLRQPLDDRQPEREVGHEVVVHDVDVHPVGAGAIRATSSARSAKSADRMLGAIWTPMARGV